MSKDFYVSFYIKGNEEAGFYAWQSTASPKTEYVWGETVNEAVSNLCRLLSGEVSEPVLRTNNRAKGLNDA